MSQDELMKRSAVCALPALLHLLSKTWLFLYMLIVKFLSCILTCVPQTTKLYIKIFRIGKPQLWNS